MAKFIEVTRAYNYATESEKVMLDAEKIIMFYSVELGDSSGTNIVLSHELCSKKGGHNELALVVREDYDTVLQKILDKH